MYRSKLSSVMSGRSVSKRRQDLPLLTLRIDLCVPLFFVGPEMCYLRNLLYGELS